MMQVITKLLLLGLITVGCSALQCWVCEDVSGEEGGCGDIDMKGELKTCPDEKALGCYISTYTSKGKSVNSRGCSPATDPSRYKCDEHITSTTSLRSCLCKGDGCNENYDTAGGPKLSCYQCSSAEANATVCGETVTDNFMKACPFNKRKGCTISKATIMAETVYTRECSTVAAASAYKCDDQSNGPTGLKYCNCHGDNCNKDWTTAAPGSGADASHVATRLIVLACVLTYFV